MYTRAFNDLKLPNPGEMVLLRITHVCSINRFFGQLKHTVSGMFYLKYRVKENLTKIKSNYAIYLYDVPNYIDVNTNFIL